MDSREFRAWLGSELATQQLSAALAESEDEKLCSACGEAITEYFTYYGIEDPMEPMCSTCGREIWGLD